MKTKFPPNRDDNLAKRVLLQADTDEAAALKQLHADVAAAQTAATTAKDSFVAGTGDQKSVANTSKLLSKLRKRLDKLPGLHKKNWTKRRRRFAPLWLKECRKLLGRSMKDKTTATEPWDVYTLAVVIHGHLPCVFAPELRRLKQEREANDAENKSGSSSSSPPQQPHHFEAVEVLQRLARASHIRTMRAHMQPPTEFEVLNEISAWRTLLALAGCDAGAKEMNSILGRAQALCAGAQKAPGSHADIGIGLGRFEEMVLFLGLSDFEARLNQAVGECKFENGTIHITALATWSLAWRKHVARLEDSFQCVASTRDKVFHNLGLDGVDILGVIQTMGDVLLALRGAGSAQAPATAPSGPGTTSPPNWRHYDMVQQARTLAAASSGAEVPVRVELTLSVVSMGIPLPNDQYFVGRVKETQRVLDALEVQGARVLIHGIQGVGKDALLAHAMRALPEQVRRQVRLAAWLHGSTDEMLRRQLIDCFLTHHGDLLRGAEQQPKECLEIIQKWLRTHDGWLFAVEDATAATTTLFNVFPYASPRGRLVVTSKEPLHSQSLLGATARRLHTTHVLELLPPDTADSLDMWRKMHVFAATVTPHAITQHRDQELLVACAITNGAVTFVPPACAEGAVEAVKVSAARHYSIVEALLEHELASACQGTTGAIMYIPPTAGETKAKAQRRREQLGGALCDYALQAACAGAAAGVAFVPPPPAAAPEPPDARAERQRGMRVALEAAGVPIMCSDMHDYMLTIACEATGVPFVPIPTGATETMVERWMRHRAMWVRIRDHTLSVACAASGGRVVHFPGGGESFGVAEARLRAMERLLEAIELEAEYPVTDFEKETEARARLKQTMLLTNEQRALASDEVKEFLEQTLGNLPLSVMLCGNMLRKDGAWLATARSAS